ncbi:MAG: DUF454 domain-containing protein [Paludibacter sp.]|nr:DUF454 domain-containing protein [Paludibacter sp.]
MKIILATFGLISLALGIIGIFVPLLPTTPFLLLSAALFSKSSTRLYAWLLNHRVLGKYIKSYREEKSIPLKVKITALVLLWGSIGFSIFFVVYGKWWLQLLLFTIAAGVTIHILSLKTKK